MMMGRAILEDVSRERMIPIVDILGSCRDDRHVRARWEVAQRCRFELGYSYPQIGMLLNRDHTTVFYMLNAKYRERKKAASRCKRKRRKGFASRPRVKLP